MAVKRKTKPQKKNEGSVIIKGDHIIYNLKPTSNQYGFVKRIDIYGSKKLPSGFYTKNLNGLSYGGYYLLKAISDGLGSESFSIAVVMKGKNEIKENTKGYLMTILHKDLMRGLLKLKKIRTEKAENSRFAAQSHMHSLFPEEINDPENDLIQYKEGTLATILETTTPDQLSKKDSKTLLEYLPDFMKTQKNKTTRLSGIRNIVLTARNSEKVFIERIINEFEELLKKTISESKWQDFYGKYILLFRLGYSAHLDQNIISIDGKKPDFLLLDSHGYLDVYEIKRPDTKLLDFDPSRKLFYWYKEMSKAIAQVELYLHKTKVYTHSLESELSTEERPINITRPRGFLIAGNRQQLDDKKKRDSFRLLSEGLKDISVLLYDDLLSHLKEFYSRIQ